jgi:hypothetical protein
MAKYGILGEKMGATYHLPHPKPLFGGGWTSIEYFGLKNFTQSSLRTQRVSD